MIDNKRDQEKRDLVIIDFDGTLFLNPDNNFGFYMPINRVIDAYTFFNEFMFQTNEMISENADCFLISGRIEAQEGVITHLLELNGYQFDQSFFNQGGITNNIDEKKTFMTKYWNGKIKLINEIKSSNQYKSIVIIDDDNVLCSALKKLGFAVFKAQITKNSSNQSLTVTFSTPQERSMTELNALLNPRRSQNKSIIEAT